MKVKINTLIKVVIKTLIKIFFSFLPKEYRLFLPNKLRCKFCFGAFCQLFIISCIFATDTHSHPCNALIVFCICLNILLSCVTYLIFIRRETFLCKGPFIYDVSIFFAILDFPPVRKCWFFMTPCQWVSDFYTHSPPPPPPCQHVSDF